MCVYVHTCVWHIWCVIFMILSDIKGRNPFFRKNFPHYWSVSHLEKKQSQNHQNSYLRIPVNLLSWYFFGFKCLNLLSTWNVSLPIASQSITCAFLCSQRAVASLMKWLLHISIALVFWSLIYRDEKTSLAPTDVLCMLLHYKGWVCAGVSLWSENRPSL